MPRADTSGGCYCDHTSLTPDARPGAQPLGCRMHECPSARDKPDALPHRTSLQPKDCAPGSLWHHHAMPSLFRELTHSLIPLIDMNCSRSQVSPKKAGPESQRIPIKRWEDVDFTVPMGSAVPGGRIRDCALKPPAVIRGRPPGKPVCSCLAGRIRPPRPKGKKFGRRARVDLGGRWLRRFAGR